MHACMHVWADVGQIGEFVLLRLWDLGLGEIVDVEFKNCWRKDYGVVLGIKRWFDELFDMAIW